MRLALTLTAFLATPALAAPMARIAPVTDDYFGHRITDPYRWMESEPQPEFGRFLHAENDHARAVLATIPGRAALAAEIGAVSGLSPRVRSVQRVAGRLFYLKREAGAQIARLVMADAAGHETVLVDPTGLGTGGQHAEIDQFVASEDGKLVVYGVSIGGSENSTLHVIDTKTRQLRPDSIDRAQFASASWAPDGGSFFYDRLPASSATARPVDQYAHQIVYRHVLGQDPAHDVAVLDSDHLPFAYAGRSAFPAVAVTPGSPYALAAVADGVSPELTVAVASLPDLLAGHPVWKKLADTSDDVVGTAVRGARIDLMTHKGAQRFQIVETGLDAPDLAHAKAIVPEQPGVLTGMAAARDGLYFATRDGAVFLAASAGGRCGAADHDRAAVRRHHRARRRERRRPGDRSAAAGRAGVARILGAAAPVAGLRRRQRQVVRRPHRAAVPARSECVSQHRDRGPRAGRHHGAAVDRQPRRHAA